ncbi:hypothetical protein ACTWPT_19640 [Nonomuraea sp. 3N208]|uniref:hypothetical protein n=1 Tax=Nonomuraea sp. 3N208 TaxID=3457421 RepID=UPI003FCE61C3
MTGLEMSMGAVGQEASRIRTHGEDSGAAVEAYGQQGDGVSSWHDDGLFGVFASMYAECRQMTVAALTGLSGEITTTGDALHTATRNMRDTEVVNTENVGGAWA